MSNSNLNRMPAGRSFRPLQGVGEALFIHAPLSQHREVARLARDDYIGSVYTLSTRTGRITTSASDVRDAVSRHRTIAGEKASLLIDANLYAGRSRVVGAQDIDGGWIDFQHNLGLPWAMTDTGYIPLGDYATLEGALNSAIRPRAQGRVLATLPIPSKWLADDADRLRTEIEKRGVTVALVLEHREDPLASKKAVSGLLHLLQSDVSISLLRSDLSVVGAIAAGAAMGAIGTGSGLRHIFPITDSSGPPPTQYKSILVPGSLGWVRQDKLAQAVQLTPQARHWICNCAFCGNARLDGLLSDSAVYSHNLASAAEIIRSVLSQDIERSTNRWAELCGAAQHVNFEIESDTSMRWNLPKYLGAWIAATHVSRVGQSVPVL